WGAEPVIAPALIMLAGTMIWTGEFAEGERWLQRTRQALQTDTGPDITLLLHQTAGLLHAGRGRHHEALEEVGAAEYLGSQLADSQALATRTTRWLLALAESDRLILPFAMTGSAGLLEALPPHQTAHAALLADILDVLHGSSPAAQEQSSSPLAEELSPGELRVLRYLPTNLSRPEI